MWAAILAGREGGHDSLFSQNERILDPAKRGDVPDVDGPLAGRAA